MRLSEWILENELDYPYAFWDRDGMADPWEFTVSIDPAILDGVDLHPDEDEITIDIGEDIPYRLRDCYIKHGLAHMEWEACCEREE